MRILVYTLGIVHFSASGQTVRVTAWSMAGKSGSSDATALQESAAALEQLKPDVILLQDVADWQMCNQLAESLKAANYSVVVCSAFRSADGQKRPQVAILSKHKAYLSWAQNWHLESGEVAPNGFVFAAIQIGQRRLAFYSLQPGPKGMVNQWLQGISGIKKWVNNRVEGLVAAGGIGPGSLDRASLVSLEDAGFSNPFISQFADLRSAGPLSAGFIANVSAPQGIVLDHWPATCDIGIEVPPTGTVITAVRGRLIPPEPAPAPVAAKAMPSLAANAPAAQNNWQSRIWWLIPALGLIALASAIRGLSASRKRLHDHRSPALLPLNSGEGDLTRPRPALIAPVSSTGSTFNSSSTGEEMVKITTSHESAEEWKQRALVAEQQAREAKELMRRGLLPQVNQWLKGKFVKQLLDDRSRTEKAQEQATMKTLHVNERLSRVEKQLQEQHRAYQERIDTLTRELRVARSENCDIIRAQISQVKSEMEASRARILAETGDDFSK